MRNEQTVGLDQTHAALDRIRDAARRIPRGRQALVVALQGGLDELQDAVDEARAFGISWETIEDALGVWAAATSIDSRNSNQVANATDSGNVIAITALSAVAEPLTEFDSSPSVGPSKRVRTRRPQLRLVRLTLDRCRRIRRVGLERIERASASV